MKGESESCEQRGCNVSLQGVDGKTDLTHSIESGILCVCVCVCVCACTCVRACVHACGV